VKTMDAFDLRPGDRVSVELDSGEIREFVVKYSPWQLGHGTWVIGLEGIAGGYALDRVRGVGFAMAGHVVWMEGEHVEVKSCDAA
jgi:hypothetical protein